MWSVRRFVYSTLGYSLLLKQCLVRHQQHLDRRSIDRNRAKSSIPSSTLFATSMLRDWCSLDPDHIVAVGDPIKLSTDALRDADTSSAYRKDVRLLGDLLARKHGSNERIPCIPDCQYYGMLVSSSIRQSWCPGSSKVFPPPCTGACVRRSRGSSWMVSSFACELSPDRSPRCAQRRRRRCGSNQRNTSEKRTHQGSSATPSDTRP